MRLLPLLLCLFVLGAFVSGCGSGGGSDTSAQTIPAAPPLTVPGGESAPAITTGATGTTGTTGPAPSSGGAAPSSGTPSSGTPSSSQGTGQQQSQSQSPSGGAQAPSSGSQTTPSNGGSAPSQFNKFCKENPGAC